MTADAIIAPGAHIEVRDAVWRVVQVNQTSSGRQAWHVVGLSEVVRDQEAIFLEEYEPEVTVLDPRETQLVIDTTAGHRQSRLYLESKLRRVPPTGPEPVLARLAALDVMEFQLEPARLALQQNRPRILIADAVGLGKTLEAGILLSELIRRGRGRRILVATVKSMLTQFQKELWTRFAIPLVRLDSAGLQRIREQIPTNHNPFHYYDKTIISIDTLKQNNAFFSHVERAEWDVIVIDEAHNVAERGAGRSQRARIAKILSERSDALILLSATPHDGRAPSFASLMNMLDPTAITDPKNYTREEIEGLFVRRFKKDVQAEIGKAFPDRTMQKVRAEATPTEEAAFDAHVKLKFSAIDRGRKRASDADLAVASTHEEPGQRGVMLFKTTLEKALLSSPAACRQTIAERIKTLESRIKTLKSSKDAAPFTADIEALREFDSVVERIDAQSFSKYQRLLTLIRDKKSGFGWSPKKKDDRIVIFSERIETLKFLRTHLKQDLGLQDAQIDLLEGGMSDKDQQACVESFGKDNAKVRILLASDVASEGINLHYLCHRLIHFDVPWSLMVFAQRNGRIDRYGQEQAPQIVYLLTDTKNQAVRGDVHILELLAERDQQARDNIGDPSALMGQYDEVAEIQMTAEAIEGDESAEAFAARLADPETLSPLELLLRGGPSSTKPTAPTISKPFSLFDSDFAYVREVLDALAETEGIERRINEDQRLIEISLPPDTDGSQRQKLPGLDLRRRFRKLPGEVLPDDGVAVLTPDRDRVQEEIKRARGEESAWPVLSYLWPLHPVVDWCNDKALAVHKRLEAPVVTLLEGLAAKEAVVLVSTLLPNRRSQPLFQEWFAVQFIGGVKKAISSFSSWAPTVGIAGRALPNRKVAVDLDALRRLVPPAVEAARAATKEHWKERETELNAKLSRELTRLEALRNRRFSQLVLDEGRRDRAEINARVNKIFDPFLRFVQESMTAGKEPFVEVLAVFRSEAGYLPAKGTKS